VFSGYWGGEVDAATHHENGFFRTGDLGRVDDDGYVYITGRAKDIIISGGTNIAPVEIEEVLLQHPAIVEAVAVPIPDAALGEVIRAVVVARGPLAAQAVLDFCAERLAKYKRPREVRIIAEPLPRNAMQKLDRKQAKALYGEPVAPSS
jgi:malonyl-CoA/methylmalonyl-CoA synthetase